MTFRAITGVRELAFAKTTAGWIVIRNEDYRAETDVLAGAFETPDLATQAARKILTQELDAALALLIKSEAGEFIKGEIK